MDYYKNVTIISPRKALKLDWTKVSNNANCYYLHDDYILFQSISAKALLSDVTVHLPGNAFHNAIDRLKNEFIDFSNAINVENGKDNYYWGSVISSRNSASTPFLKYLIYMILALDIVRKNSLRETVIIVESLAIRKSLCEQLAIDEVGRIEFFFASTRVFLSLSKRLCSFAIYVTKMMLLTRIVRHKAPDFQSKSLKKVVVLRSYITNGNILVDGQYNDRNFGPLSEFLQRNGFDVWINPMLFNLKESLFSLVKNISKSSQQFLLIEKFINPSDVIAIIYRELRSILTFTVPHGLLFDGVDVSQIAKEAHWYNAFSFDSMKFNLLDPFFSRIASRKWQIDKIIYPFESNSVEKILIRSIRKLLPGTSLVAFQHSVWFKEQLGMMLNDDELRFHPIPDKIITSGKIYRHILIESGFPVDLIKDGVNLRYHGVNNIKCTPLKNEKCSKILVLLNYSDHHACELLDKVCRAMKSLQSSFEISVKAHPITSKGLVERSVSHIGFSQWTWVDGVVLDLVSSADMVIMTMGSVSNLEVMAMGVPLIRVSLDSSFDLDPLWSDYPLISTSKSVDDLSLNIKKVSNFSEKESQIFIDFAAELVEQYFEPVSDKGMEVFLS